MKNRQLMRLNKVSHNGIIKTIDCISPGYVSFIEDIKSDDNFGYWVNLDEIEFIPLTEEILLKCGFVSGIRLQDFVKGKYCFVEIFVESLGIKFYGEFSENGVFYFNSKTEINHIHQLQNLYYALTNEELQINL